MLCKIRCNQIHRLNDALPGPYVAMRVTRGALIAHRYTYWPPLCRTSQYRSIFVRLSMSPWNALPDPIFDGVGLAGFKSRANALYWTKLIYTYYSLLLFLNFSSFCLLVGIVGLWSSDWLGVYHSLSAFTADLFLIIIIKNNWDLLIGLHHYRITESCWKLAPQTAVFLQSFSTGGILAIDDFTNIYNIYVRRYPWYSIFIYGIHGAQFKCLVSMIHRFMSLTHDTQDLFLVSIIKNIFMTRNTFVWYPWYNSMLARVEFCSIFWMTITKDKFNLFFKILLK